MRASGCLTNFDRQRSAGGAALIGGDAEGAQFSATSRMRPQLGLSVLSWPITLPFTMLLRRGDKDIAILRIVDGKRRITRQMVRGEEV